MRMLRKPALAIAFAAAVLAVASPASAQEDLTPPDDLSPPDYPYNCVPIGGGDISDVIPPDDVTASTPSGEGAGVPAQEDLTPPDDSSGPDPDDDVVVCAVPDLAATGGLPVTGTGESDAMARWLQALLFVVAGCAMLVVATGAVLGVKRA
jgi:hypothetical protein